jgi:hypothetical protein
MGNKVWPFVFMKEGTSEVFTGLQIHKALTRLVSVKRTRPDMFFSIEFYSYNEMHVTKVCTEAEAHRERRPGSPVIKGRNNWLFRYLSTGESLEFDITFTPNEVTRIGDYARTYGRSKGWKIQVRTTNTADGRRIITVTRIS